MTALAGKRVLVTGAGGGIGAATAKALLAAGAEVHAAGRRPDALRARFGEAELTAVEAGDDHSDGVAVVVGFEE